MRSVKVLRRGAARARRPLHLRRCPHHTSLATRRLLALSSVRRRTTVRGNSGPIESLRQSPPATDGQCLSPAVFSGAAVVEIGRAHV